MTKEERLLQALGDVGDDLIQEAVAKPKRLPWRSMLATAACLVLVVGLVRLGGFGGMAGGGANGSADGADSTAFVDAGVPLPAPGEDKNEPAVCDTETMLQAAAYDVYTGPVMPMSLTEPAEGLEAKRSVVYDFASYTETDPEVYRIHTDVTDSYALYNYTDADMTVTAVYPVMAKLSDHDVLLPHITVDGTETETELLVGGELYWDGYVDSGAKLKQVLDDGSYFAEVFEGAPDLSQPVTVYSVTGLTYDGPVGERPTLAMEFTADPARSNALICGGMAVRYDDESGETQLRMTVEEFIYGEDIHVIVMGEDMDGYTLQGYSDFSCKEGTEVDGFRAEIVRAEMTLREFLAQYVDWEYWGKVYNDGLKRCIGSYLTADELIDETARTMDRAGALVNAGHMNGMLLNDYISNAFYAGRVLYVSFPVTVPAGESVTVTADMVKYAHVLEHGRGEDIHGYDLMTKLGSVLDITEQTVAAVNTENVVFEGGNLGDVLAGSDAPVLLDPDGEYYWLHVRKE